MKGRGENKVSRTVRVSEKRRRKEKWQTFWCFRDHWRACRIAQASTKKLEQTGPAKKERVTSVLQSELTRTPEPPLPKGEERSHQSRAPDGELGESQDEPEPRLGEREREESEREHGEERASSTVKKGGLEKGKERQASKKM